MRKFMILAQALLFAALVVFATFQPCGAELTNFPNGITSFGIPVIPGMELGKVWGNTYFVDATDGSDDNDGKSPDVAKITIQAAINLTGDAKGDRIYVRNGAYAETLTISTSHDNIMIIGESRANVVITGAGDATDVLTIAADDCTIANMSFAPYDTDSDISLIVATGDNNRVESCDFAGGEYQIETTTAGDTMIVGCNFVTLSDVTDGAAISLTDSDNCKVLYCNFYMDTASDGIIHHDADNLEVGWCNGVGDDDTGASAGSFILINGTDATSELSVHDCNITLFAALICEVSTAVAAHGLGTSDLASTDVSFKNSVVGCTVFFDTAE